jgi:uncharacterized membrane protein YkvA (DUF1232 family)
MRKTAPRRKMDSVLGLLNLHNTGKLFWRLVLDRRVSILLKCYAASGLVYFFSPLDVVPHDFTGVGLVDDMIVALVIMQAFIEMAPPKVVDEHCEALGIDPDKILMPVPIIIKDAMEMFFAGREQAIRRDWGTGPRDAATPPTTAYQTPEAEPPPYSRYSAFREDG